MPTPQIRPDTTRARALLTAALLGLTLCGPAAQGQTQAAPVQTTAGQPAAPAAHPSPPAAQPHVRRHLSPRAMATLEVGSPLLLIGATLVLALYKRRRLERQGPSPATRQP